jgi:site-specific DNA-methyltransferase (adenine-specific)
MPGDLYYGDNLDVLRSKLASESVDLVYLDPPFNSQQDFNLIHKASKAQENAFRDTWTWDDAAECAFAELTGHAPPSVRIPVGLAEMMRTLKGSLGSDRRDTMAYLAMMAIRLVEMHRVLRSTGSLYLHCDPTASHYLKIILDAIFGADSFQNEIIWQRTNARTAPNRWPRVHDVILFYSKGKARVFHPLTVPGEEAKLPHTLITGADGRKYQTYELTAPHLRFGETGKAWRGFQPAKMGRCWANPPSVMDEWDQKGLIHWPKKKGAWPRRVSPVPFEHEARMVTVGDVWTDIDRLNQTAKERLGYPTQKPLALVSRIVEASSKPGELVLDPFCGCGTTVEAAEHLGRRWIGIDVAIRAIDVIKDRLDEKFQHRTWRGVS